MAREKEPQDTPKTGELVLVHYLENPNAIEASAPGRVLKASSGGRLDVELARPGPGQRTLRLAGVPAHDGGPRPRRPSWSPMKREAAKPKD